MDKKYRPTIEEDCFFIAEPSMEQWFAMNPSQTYSSLHEIILYGYVLEIIDEDSIQSRKTKQFVSLLLEEFLNEIDPKHFWAEHEIEQMIHPKTLTNPNATFRKWLREKKNTDIDIHQAGYLQKKIDHKNDPPSKNTDFNETYNDFLKHAHPSFAQQLSRNEINDICRYEKLVGEKVENDIILNGDEDWKTIEIDDKTTSGWDPSLFKSTLDPEAITSMMNSERSILYLGPESPSSMGRTSRDFNRVILLYDKKNKQINRWRSPVFSKTLDLLFSRRDLFPQTSIRFCHSKDYLRGSRSNEWIKRILLEKMENWSLGNLQETDDLIDVVGQNFIDGAKAYIAQHVKRLDEVKIIADKTNAHDAYALLVIHGSKSIGYIQSKRNLDVHQYLLDNPGISVKVYEILQNGNVRLLFQGVKKLKDKETPGSKYLKHIYENIVETFFDEVMSILKKYCVPKTPTNEEVMNDCLDVILVAMRNWMEETDDRLFQPLLKTLLKKRFAGKDVFDFQSLSDINDASEDAVDHILHVKQPGDYLYPLIKRIGGEKNVGNDVHIAMIGAYVRSLILVKDAIIVSRHKNHAEDRVFSDQIRSIERTIIDLT